MTDTVETVGKEYHEYWEPLLKTDGQFDAEKIKNEMCDLIFVANQVGKIYMTLTGGKLSKPFYEAGTIISLNEDEMDAAYQRGYDEALEEAAHIADQWDENAIAAKIRELKREGK